MSLENFGSQHEPESLEQYSKSLLDKYGLEACEAASKLEDSDISEGTARSYKPQIRQIVSKLGETNPDPHGVLEIISELDKKPSSKNIMIVAMKKYYQQIGERERGEELHTMAKNSGIAEIDFNRDMQVEEWITKQEIERIEKHILPAKGEQYHEVSGPGKSWVITLEHKALVMTLFYTGCRVGEVCARKTGDEALSVEDLYPDSDQIRLYRLKKKGKGYKRDMKVVPEILWDVLDGYMEQYGITEGRLFPFVTRTAQNRIAEIDEVYKFVFGDFEHMDKLTPHKFRHGRITDLANHAGLEDAGQYVEHSSTEITNSYRHLAAEQQRSILPEESKDVEGDRTLEELMEEAGVDSKDELVEKLKQIS